MNPSYALNYLASRQLEQILKYMYVYETPRWNRNAIQIKRILFLPLVQWTLFAVHKIWVWTSIFTFESNRTNTISSPNEHIIHFQYCEQIAVNWRFLCWLCGFTIFNVPIFAVNLMQSFKWQHLSSTRFLMNV